MNSLFFQEFSETFVKKKPCFSQYSKEQKKEKGLIKQNLWVYINEESQSHFGQNFFFFF